METLQCIKERRSVRKFTDEIIDQDTLSAIVEAASYAPSWKNTQITRYNVIQNQDLIQRIANEGVLGFTYNAKTISNAKNIVIVSYVEGRSGYERDGSFTTSKGEQWQMFDAGIATQTFSLAAWEYGIGTVVMGIFDEAIIKDIIQLPEGESVGAILAIGKPAEEPKTPRRKTVDDLLRIIK